MAWFLRVFVPSKRFLTSVFLCFDLLLTREPVWAINELAFTFENADIQTVIKQVGEFTGTTFLFDLREVKGKITILSRQKVAPEGALKLLASALALHGYTLLRKAEGMWIIPTGKVIPAPTVIEVVPLQYANADEVADTLAWVAPYGV